uniref:Uncharacterized protein n=1 Tax=Lepeophtheirus salmonis TaxID=72036 RepID=A0A0K2TY87_LEPSM
MSMSLLDIPRVFNSSLDLANRIPFQFMTIPPTSPRGMFSMECFSWIAFSNRGSTYLSRFWE